MSPEPTPGALKNTDQLIQVYTAEYTGRYRQIQADTHKYDFQISAIRAYVCHAQAQADEGKMNCHISVYVLVSSYKLSHISLFIQADTDMYEKDASAYSHVCVCI